MARPTSVLILVVFCAAPVLAAYEQTIVIRKNFTEIDAKYRVLRQLLQANIMGFEEQSANLREHVHNLLYAMAKHSKGQSKSTRNEFQKLSEVITRNSEQQAMILQQLLNLNIWKYKKESMNLKSYFKKLLYAIAKHSKEQMRSRWETRPGTVVRISRYPNLPTYHAFSRNVGPPKYSITQHYLFPNNRLRQANRYTSLACAYPWVSYAHMCLMYGGDQRGSWFKANQFCKSYGGFLAWFDNKMEHQMANAFLKRYITGGDSSYWVGLYRTHNGAPIAWNGGSTSSYRGDGYFPGYKNYFVGRSLATRFDGVDDWTLTRCLCRRPL